MKIVITIIGISVFFLYGCTRSPKEKIVYKQKMLRNSIYRTEQQGMLLAMKTTQIQNEYSLEAALTMPEYTAIRKDMDIVAAAMLRYNKSYDSLKIELKKY